MKAITNYEEGMKAFLDGEIIYHESGAWWVLRNGRIDKDSNGTIWFPILTDHGYYIKPKTITINGIEVPAPLKKRELKDGKTYYGIFKGSATEFEYKKDSGFVVGHAWESFEDCNDVIDAMIKPIVDYLSKEE